MKSIFLTGVVGWDITFENIKEKMSGNEDVRILISSPGGSPWEAFLIYNYLRMYPGKIEFVVFGMALSAMSIILLAGNKQGNSISVLPTSTWMGHRVQMYTYGDSDQVIRDANLAIDTENLIIQLYMERMKQPEKEIRKLLQDEYWLTGGQKIIDAGLADKLYQNAEEIGMEVDPEEEKEIEETINITIEMSNQLAHAKFENVKKMMREKEYSEKERAEFAAFYNEYKTTNKKSLVDKFKDLLNIVDKKTLDSENKTNNSEKNPENLEFQNMELKEFIEKNPSQKTALENLVKEKADELLKNKAKSAVEDEKNRIAKILEYENVGVSELAAKAIDDDMSLEDYKDMKIKNEAEKRTEKKVTKFGSLTNKQTPGDQGKDLDDKKIPDKEYDEAMDKSIENRFGGKN